MQSPLAQPIEAWNTPPAALLWNPPQVGQEVRSIRSSGPWGRVVSCSSGFGAAEFRDWLVIVSGSAFESGFGFGSTLGSSFFKPGSRSGARPAFGLVFGFDSAVEADVELGAESGPSAGAAARVLRAWFMASGIDAGSAVRLAGAGSTAGAGARVVV